MTDLAVMPRGDAVATEAGNMVRTDGRNRRAAETRRKIIEAAKVMIAETSVAPTVVGVARRADVSVRSVFQHFHDVESLFVTVTDSIRADIAVPELPSANRPLSARVESIVAAFAELFDKVVPLRVAAGQFVDHPALIERSQTARNELREATFEVFAPEFASLSEHEREQLADAIGSALSLDAWIVLRRRDGLSVERATAVWRLTLTALFAQAEGAAKAREVSPHAD
jgi:TetR/AcrR family transcriptional regulator of autoinduction and epiphytic fitness